jgi:hypothetical protein
VSRTQQRTGKHGEDVAVDMLLLLGVREVERIGTPVRLVPAREEGTYRVFWGERVAGDMRGVMDNGLSVLAETKTIRDRKLRWSDFRPHQPAALSRHAEYALSLVVWVHSSGVYVMRWPIDGFGPRKSIGVEQAEVEHSATISLLNKIRQ